MRKQLELDNIPRKRVALVEDAAGDEPRVVGPNGELKMDLEAFIGYSKWFNPEKTPPPCTGYWDVNYATQESARIWYDAYRRLWRWEGPNGPVVDWPHEYRGLVKPWFGGYQYYVPSVPLSAPRPRVQLLE